MAIHNIKGAQDISAGTGVPTGKAERTAKAGHAAQAYAKAANSNSVKDAANVQISQRAKEMSMAKKVAEQTPEVDEARIQKYKEMIAKGEYKPDAGKIADGIAREALLDKYASNQG